MWKLFAIIIATIIVGLAVADDGIKNESASPPCTSEDCNEGRTFGIGHRRRMAMMFLPVMFKLGVIMTLLIGLTVLAFKGLTIGVILLVFAFGGLFSKLKTEHGHKSSGGPVHVHLHDFEHQQHHSYGGGGWDRLGENNPQWEDYMSRKWQAQYPNRSWYSKGYRQ